jgi:predicted PhzF superfamily epimerase YddE/YHI9
VCVLDSGWPDTQWLQRLAAEFNLPAPVFIDPCRPRPELRWFSPRTELALCGSGALAAAHILWETGEQSDALVFTTCAGDLSAHREPDCRITLDFPADGLRSEPVSSILVAALGV